MGSLDDLHLAGEAVAKGFDGWPDAVRAEFDRRAFNGHVGGVLLHETDRVRVWDVRLGPGERLPAHRHVLDYFWTALTGGRGRQHVHDGTTREVSYVRGETRSYTFGPGAYLLHDLENLGDEPLAFVTVELLESANRPLPLG